MPICPIQVCRVCMVKLKPWTSAALLISSAILMNNIRVTEVERTSAMSKSRVVIKDEQLEPLNACLVHSRQAVQAHNLEIKHVHLNGAVIKVTNNIFRLLFDIERNEKDSHPLMHSEISIKKIVL